MTTFTAFTTLEDQSEAETLALALEEMPDPVPTGVGVFAVEDGSGTWEVGAFFTERPDEIALALLCAANNARPFVVSKVPDTDWVAQVRRELSPVYAGRFVVYGSHDRDVVPDHLIRLEIEAAMAFGTGHHGTTQGCLTAFDKILRDGFAPRFIADIGTGTGVLAMAAAKVLPSRIIASDIDDQAVATARANIAFNRLGSRIPVVRAAGFRNERLRAAGPFDLILANILANPLRRLASDMTANTVPGAILILSGILTRQAQSVIRTYEGHGFVLVRREVIGEWTTLTLRRVDGG